MFKNCMSQLTFIKTNYFRQDFYTLRSQLLTVAFLNIILRLP